VVKAVIFDFDGVLAESVDIKTRAFAKLFEPEGPEAVSEIVRYHTEHGGVSRFDKIRYMFNEFLGKPLPEGRFEEMCNRFQHYVLDGVINAPEVKGALECLERLHGSYLMFIVSGTPEEELRLIVEKRSLGGYFNGVFGAPASKTYLVNSILAEHGLAPDEAVLVGDSITDYNASVETGVGFVARATGRSVKRWQELGATTIEDLSGCIPNI
jgi:phosphoglycolate phosphatase-like HAD superfamily hydrolase